MVQNNSPPKSHVLLASWLSSPPLPLSLPHSASLSSSPSHLPRGDSHGAYGGLLPGVAWGRNRVGGHISSSPSFWGKGGNPEELPPLKNICTINRMKLCKIIVLLTKCKGIPILQILRSENLCLLQELFQRGSEIWHTENPIPVRSQHSSFAAICR